MTQTPAAALGAVGARSTGSVRATPMAPEQRRAAIVAAALPLVARYGAAVTTRQIAEAAGVAEGTLFRVFLDKPAILDAVVESITDDGPALARLCAIPGGLDLRELITAVVEVTAARMLQMWDVLGALHVFGPPGAGYRSRALQRPMPAPEDDPLTARVSELLEPFRRQLRPAPAEVTSTIRMLVIAATHPRISGGRPFSVDSIVSLLLDGVLVHAP